MNKFIVLVLLSAASFISYNIGKHPISFNTNDTVNIDSIPEGKVYKATKIIYNNNNNSLGTNPLLNHQVPTNYEGNDNNWDEDLDKIK